MSLRIYFLFYKKRLNLAPIKDAKKSINGFAVVLIDMQPYFIKRFKKNQEKRIIPYQISVIRWCSRNHIPLFVLENQERGKTTSILRKELEKVKNLITIKKLYDNGFTATELGNIIKNMGIKNLFFMGINARSCVLSTARWAIDKEDCQVLTCKDVIAGDLLDSLPWYKENSLLINVEDLVYL